MEKNFKKDNLDRLKREISILSLAEKSGFTLVKHGSKDFAALCRWHDDKNPSLIFSPSKNLFNCPACADVKGSVIDWVMLTEKVSTAEAIKILKDLLPPGSSAMVPINGKEPPSLRDKKTAPASQSSNNEAEALRVEITDMKYQQLLKRSFGYFNRSVKYNSNALNLFQKRGIVGDNILEEFQIGYADGSFLSKLPNGKEGKDIKELLKEIGLLNEKGRLLFSGCLVFPIFDEKQNIVEVYGRRVLEKKGLPNHLYLPGKHQGIFNLKAVDASREIILCESILDALSFWVHGFKNVTASYGTGGFTGEHLSLFKHHKIETVYLAFDNDDAGNEASVNLATLLAANGITAYRIEFPKGLDANDYIQRVKAPRDNLKLLIQNAVPLTDKTILSAKDENKIFFNLPKEQKTDKLEWTKRKNAYFFTIGQRRYSFFGLEKNHSQEVLKVRVKIKQEGRTYSDNAIDLFHFKTVKSLIRLASEKLELEEQIIEKDLDNIIPVLEEVQHDLVEDRLKSNKTKEILISEVERETALEYLKSPSLIDKIIADFEKIGLIGEGENSLIGYLSASSRKDDRPLAIIIQSSSGAGKTTFMDAVLSLMPDEEVVKFSALTDQSLYYMETSLKNKILAIVEEEGAARASYSLKLLQSEGQISIASTGKDPDTGKMVTETYEVEGPVMIFLATTKADIDEELKNRCLILTVNEAEEQTGKILKLQRDLETLDGLVKDASRSNIIELHKNIQRLLRPIHVINNFAKDLKFTTKDHRSRRDQKKYLTLIRMIAFLHQYQREIKTITLKGRTLEYIEVTIEDIELANKLALKIFGVSLDELPPQTRLFLDKLYSFVLEKCKKEKIDQEDCRFNKRDVASSIGIGITQVGIHLTRLEEFEYIRKWFGKRGQTNVYELVYNGGDGDNLFVYLNLVDTELLRKKYGSKQNKSA